MIMFERSNLPFSSQMKNEWKKSGFLVIRNFYSNAECDKLRNAADRLVGDFDPESVKSIFDTKKQEHVEDKYFLESGDKIRFFF